MKKYVSWLLFGKNDKNKIWHLTYYHDSFFSPVLLWNVKIFKINHFLMHHFLYCNFQQAIKFNIQRGGKCVIATNLWNILEIHQLSNIPFQGYTWGVTRMHWNNCKVSDINNVYWPLMHKSAHICLKCKLAIKPADINGNICIRKANLLLNYLLKSAFSAEIPLGSTAWKI